MIIGIALVSIVSWPRDTPITFFPRTAVGDSQFEFFKNVVGFHPIKQTLLAQDWDLSKVGGQFVLAVFTMLYVDVLDATGTLYSMARFSGVVDPDTGDFPRSTIAYCADAVAISIGSLFGSSPATAFVESGVSIVSLSTKTAHMLTHQSGWYPRRRSHRAHSYHDRPFILHVPLLRPNLRFNPTLGHRRCPHPRRLHDDARRPSHKLELSRGLYPSVRHADVHAFLVLDSVRSDCWYYDLHYRQRYDVGSRDSVKGEVAPTRL
jgi:hypothetical protein